MEKFLSGHLEDSFARLARAAAKGHEESIWILSVWNDVEMKQKAWKEAFAKTEEPLGWYFAGLLSFGRERVDFWKKSAEGGCSWGQVRYGGYFRRGRLVELDEKAYVEWLEKAANQKNPKAIYWLGNWFGFDGRDKQKAVSYFRAAVELGWEPAMRSLVEMLRNGEGCERDLRQAVIRSAKGSDSYEFWDLLEEAKRALESGATKDLGCDFDRLCYSLGWGLFWYQYDSKGWNQRTGEIKPFGNRCLDYYCSCVELQQKSIFTFLLCWNQTAGGIKGPGQMIAKMVWERREDNLVKTL
jgi:hypothetical protein